MAVDDNDDLCHHSDLPTAIEAARKLYVQLTASDCPVYALAFAAALRTIAIENIVDGDLTKGTIQRACNHYGERTRQLVNMADLKQDIKIKRHVLHN